MSSSSVETLTDFPSWALQPRAETGATSFMTKYPEYDGRGTIIAIFDSGVDPGAGGLQITTDGKPKVIERIDASGAGDVDMSKQVEPAGNKITGVTGKVLTVPSSWCESSIDGKFRIGSKRAFGLYPKPLRDRMSRERLEKLWDPGHKVNLAKTTSEIQVFEAAKSGTGDALTGVDKLAKDNLDAGLDLLTQLDKKMRTNNGLGSTNGLEADIGPTFDVVSFHDGQHWNVIIDNTPDGDLENALKLRPFTETRDFAPLTKSDNLNVSVNVYDDGEVVQIVSISGSHGTHVSSIAVANFPDAPEKNGLAPGAQIVSVTIGDGRLSSMETGTALVRAMAYIMQRMEEGLKIDLINMSYGEHSHWSNAGKVGDMMAEIINKYGVTWVASAGNDGPALCTVGTPPDINTNTVIGVGAYVSPEMMVAMYSSREKLPAAPYTWTSRGPTIDGDRGVTICAPGGAITSVPAFTLRGSQLMNGTSMASPHTCGAISLLISGLRQRGLDHTPFSIKRSLAASAKALPHLCHYAQGHGLLQIEAAFEHLNKYVQSVDRDVRFSVSCNTGSSASKGIHLRDFDVDKPVEVAIKIEPFFLDPDNRQAQDKINFNMKFALGCTATWVKHPSHLDLMYTVRHFLVQVDPTGLDKGVHTTYINAYDANQPDKGPLFEIPITVVKPEPLVQLPRPHVQYKEIVFNPGTIKRTFVKVPDQATWAVVRVHSNETAATGKFVLHTVLLLPKKVVKTYENHKMFTLAENGEWTYAFPIEGGYILEVCLAKWWANIGSINASYSITFQGILPDQKEVVFHGADSIARVNVTSGLHQEDVHPEAKLKCVVQNYRPSEAKVIALGERDVIPPHRNIYELQLTYNFNVPKATEITPNLSLLTDVLYESEFISQLWLLYNSHKQVVDCGDAYANKWTMKVDKDDYVLKATVRHEKREVLDKMLDLPLMIASKLSSPINLDIYSSFSQASVGGKKCSALSVPPKTTVPIYLAAPSTSDKHTKSAMLGQYLQGTMTFAKDDIGKKTDLYTIKYFLNDAAKKDKQGRGKKTETTPTFAESLAEHKIGWLAKLDPNSDEGQKLFSELKNVSNANQVQVLLARATAFDIDRKINLDAVTNEKAEEVLALTNEILDQIKEEDLLQYTGIKYDARPDASEIKKDMEKNKGVLIDALAKKGIALCILGKADEATDVLFKALKFTDITDSKVILFAIIHAERIQHNARAVKLILHQLETKPNSIDLEQRLIQLYEKMGWAHLAYFAKESLFTRFPTDYEMF